MNNFGGMNPMQLMGQVMGSKNPMEALTNMVGANNPILKQAISMTQGKSQDEIMATVNNLCQSNGWDMNQVKQMARNFGINF